MAVGVDLQNLVTGWLMVQVQVPEAAVLKQDVLDPPEVVTMLESAYSARPTASGHASPGWVGSCRSSMLVTSPPLSPTHC